VTPARLEELLQEGTAAPSENPALSRQPVVDLVTAAELRQETLAVEAEYDVTSSTGLLARATQHLTRITVLRNAAANARVRRELWSVEADTATLMGQLTWDASQRRDVDAPLRYFDQAVHAARQIQDTTAEAYAILRTSYVALYGAEKQPHAGLTAARQSAKLARPVSPALSGLALLHVAEANAMLGDRQACETALDAADRLRGLVGEMDVAGEYFSVSEIDRMAGSCYLFLGLTHRAEGPLLAAAEALNSKKKSQAIVLGNLSLARLRRGEVDGAVEVLHQAIDALEVTRGGGGLNVAFTAGRELQPWRQQTSVAEASERLFALMAGA
jgi:hypothetical protein